MPPRALPPRALVPVLLAAASGAVAATEGRLAAERAQRLEPVPRPLASPPPTPASPAAGGDGESTQPVLPEEDTEAELEGVARSFEWLHAKLDLVRLSRAAGFCSGWVLQLCLEVIPPLLMYTPEGDAGGEDFAAECLFDLG